MLGRKIKLSSPKPEERFPSTFNRTSATRPKIPKIDFYEIIAKKFAKFLISEEKKSDALIKKYHETDILEYILLEAAGCLELLQEFPLSCRFLPGYTQPRHFTDNHSRSGIVIGSEKNTQQLKNRLEQAETQFLRASAGHFGHYSDDILSLSFTVILFDSYVEQAINTSSLCKAAGDLSGLSIKDLRALREKINLYTISDNKISELVERLDHRISQEIEAREVVVNSVAKTSPHCLFSPKNKKEKATDNSASFCSIFFAMLRNINGSILAFLMSFVIFQHNAASLTNESDYRKNNRR